VPSDDRQRQQVGRVLFPTGRAPGHPRRPAAVLDELGTGSDGAEQIFSGTFDRVFGA
jgi:hypothetical protein